MDPLLLAGVAYMVMQSGKDAAPVAPRAPAPLAPVPEYVRPVTTKDIPAGEYLKRCAAGAGVGAMIGSVVPGAGTAIGAGIGCVAGIGSGLIEEYWD